MKKNQYLFIALTYIIDSFLSIIYYFISSNSPYSSTHSIFYSIISVIILGIYYLFGFFSNYRAIFTHFLFIEGRFIAVDLFDPFLFNFLMFPAKILFFSFLEEESILFY